MAAGVERATKYPIDYGEEMLARVRAMHRGAETLPGYDGWIRDHMGGRVVTFRERLLPQILAFTDLRDQRVLDFGCGTGSTTVALAERALGGSIAASDIDVQSLETARVRFKFHGIDARVRTSRIAPVRHAGDLPFAAGAFDFVLANGVLEHVVPFEARSAVILEIWRILAPGGVLFVSETPNVLWPVDRHTTGLPFMQWLPSRLAYRYAVAMRRHRPGADLEVRGRRGISYWGIVRPLQRSGQRFEVLNITRARNRLVPAGPSADASWKRRLAGAVLESTAARPLSWLGIPTIAFGPFIEFLGLRKLS